MCEYVIYLSFTSAFGIFKMLPSKLGKHGLYKTTIKLALLKTTYSCYKWYQQGLSKQEYFYHILCAKNCCFISINIDHEKLDLKFIRVV